MEFLTGNGFGGCRHNARTRYTHGFYCRDCNTWFGKESPTYRRGELLSSIFFVLNNINADRGQRGLPYIDEVQAMKDKIGIGKKHENYEEIIAEAEAVMKKYGVNSESASMTIG